MAFIVSSSLLFILHCNTDNLINVRNVGHKIYILKYCIIKKKIELRRNVDHLSNKYDKLNQKFDLLFKVYSKTLRFYL